ncbi:MAG: arginine--tRNA ligase, partial [Acidobacteriota bacterium]
MLDVVITRVRRRVASLLRERLQVPDFEVTIDIPPSRRMGDLAVPTALSLARVLRRNPREIAEELAAGLTDTPGVARAEVAGPGYVNLFLARGPYLRDALGAARGVDEPPPGAVKVILEHTNINPNKAAHIGHLRNAALGDCLARCLRYLGEAVEVQNYIDDTGVQVADLVVGFQHLRRMSLDEVRRIRERFDYHCWDLYAEVTAFYAEDNARLSMRADTLAQMEKGGNRTAEMAAHVADRIVRAHLRTMGRLGIHYDLLPKESDILAHRFWDEAFGRLKAAGAVQFVDAGDKAGCWTMTLPGEGGRQEEEKIIVRSNGTVTYVGKDIAYQMWKFGLLKDAGHGTDFEYRPFHRYEDGSLLWTTTPAGGEERHPSFGGGDAVVNVIDSRQSYLQRVVAESLRRLGHPDKADRSTHFAYEMVALTPRCAREMGFEISEEDATRPYVEMSGRKGQGVKADDLIDRLIEKAAGEVRRRKVVADGEVDAVAASIAIGALKYFLLKYGRNKVVAFDFEEVLAFEGETGPYVQYAVVRASNIFAKLRERQGYRLADLAESLRRADYGYLEEADDAAAGGTDHWELVLEITR